MDKGYYNLRELADELDVHFNTIYKYVSNGYINTYRMGRNIRVSIEEVERIKKEGIKLHEVHDTRIQPTESD